MIRSDNKDECDYTFAHIGSDELMQLNGGVFCYQRNSRTHSFFEAWHTEWKLFSVIRQRYFVRCFSIH
jgi:hypothetical protein